jgi:sugar lactone lactonase YvrE
MKRNTATMIKGLVFVLVVIVSCGVVWIRAQRVGADRQGLGHSFDFDVSEHMTIDPALMTYEELDPIAIELDHVSALATGPGNQIVVGGDQTLLVLSENGTEQSRIPLDGTPRGLAVDAASGTIYMSMEDHIEVFDATGKRLAVWAASSEDAQPASIVLRGKDLFVSELTHARVLHYDTQGQPMGVIQGLVVFSSPNIGLGLDPQQRLWVANPGARELRRYDNNGVIADSWQKPGRGVDSFSGCCNPVDIAVRADGAIVTAEKNIVRVKVVSPTGDLIGVVAGPSSFDASISKLDIALDGAGRVLILDPVRKAVRIFVERSK